MKNYSRLIGIVLVHRELEFARVRLVDNVGCQDSGAFIALVPFGD